MEPFMKYISRIYRSSMVYRGNQLKEELTGIQQNYIFQICKHPGISQDELAGLILVNKSNVTRHLSSLEEKGYIERKSDEKDRRCLHIYPTQKAIILYPKIKDVMRQWKGLLLKELSDEQRDMLQEVLPKLAKAAEKLVKEDEHA